MLKNSDLIKYLNVLFDDNEHVVIASKVQNTASVPLGEIPHLLHTWEIQKWVSCNPYIPRMPRACKNLKHCRNFVIERDDLPNLDAQLKWADDVKLPYATAVFSGNKSIHFVISLAEPICIPEYKAYAKRLKKAFPCIDSGCLEPTRLTRIPSASQPLVYIPGNRIKNENFISWLDEIAPFTESKPLKTQVFTCHMTHTTMNFLVGNTSKELAHAASLHAAKNLFEIGLSEDEVLAKMTGARQIYLPDEPYSLAEDKTRKIVEWVVENWNHEDI